MPSCPVHGTPLLTWPSGDHYCPRKTDGEWCSFILKADGTESTRKPKSAPKRKISVPSMPHASSIAKAIHDATSGSAAMVNDLRCQAALDFASRIYAGTQDSHSALELARAIVRHWDVTWKEP